MIVDTGFAALWLAAALAVVQLLSRSRPVAIAQAVMAAVAACAMVGAGPSMALVAAAVLLALALITIYRRSRWSRRSPTANVGIGLASVGAGLLGLGVACDLAFSQQASSFVKPGDQLHVGPWLVEFTTVNPVAGPDFTAIEAELRASRGSGVRLLKPQWRTMNASVSSASHIAVEAFWNGQLSAILDAPSDRRQLHLRWRPFIPLVWLGAASVALGGLIALIGQLMRQWHRRPQPRGRYE